MDPELESLINDLALVLCGMNVTIIITMLIIFVVNRVDPRPRWKKPEKPKGRKK